MISYEELCATLQRFNARRGRAREMDALEEADAGAAVSRAAPAPRGAGGSGQYAKAAPNKAPTAPSERGAGRFGDDDGGGNEDFAEESTVAHSASYPYDQNLFGPEDRAAIRGDRSGSAKLGAAVIAPEHDARPEETHEIDVDEVMVDDGPRR